MYNNKKHTLPLTALLTTLGACLMLAASATVHAQGSKNAMNGQPFQSLQNQIDAANTTLEELEALSPTMAELQEEVYDLAQALAAMSEQFESLNTDAEENAEAIAALIADMADIDGELASKQDILDGACDEGATLRAIYPDGGFLCEVGGGAAGSIATTIQVSGFVTVPRSRIPRPIQSSCPAGFQVTGAGYEADTISYRDNFKVLSSIPVDASTWQMMILNYFDSAGTVRVRMRMVCVQ